MEVGVVGLGGTAWEGAQAADTTVLSDLDALPLVERWLEERGKLRTVGQGAPLFCTLKGTPTDPSAEAVVRARQRVVPELLLDRQDGHPRA